MLNTGTRKLGSRAGAVTMRRRFANLGVIGRLGGRQYLAPATVALAVAVLVLLRITWTQTPDGDPALHLRLIKDIASTRSLPTELPFHPARVGEGGEIQAMFPYSYPPLYHLTAGVAYAVAGLGGVLMLNALSAGVIAFVVYRFVRRASPWYVAALAAPATFISPFVQTPFAAVYMEPMMLAFLFSGAWCCYLAMTTREPRYGIAAGVLLGLSLAVRQNAMFPVFVIGLVILFHLYERRCWHMARLRLEAPWLCALVVSAALAAAPSILYLVQVTGTMGYADVSLPGMHPTLAVDPLANAYVASITKPDMSPIGWLSRYEHILLYSDRWLPIGFAALPLALFVAGSIHLNRRGGAARFFARWALLQMAVEMAVFVTLHGNARYVIASQMLFYAIVPIGGYALACAALRWGRQRGNVRYAALALVAIAVPAAVYVMVPAGFVRDAYLQSRDRDLRAFRGAEYAEMGAWVNANTPPDALILTPRAYTAELTWQRNVTWVTFYGNTWVVDAITTPEAAEASTILRRYGVDYVLVSDPPGTYIDRMPGDGMRSYLQLGNDDDRHFELVHATESLGQYRAGLREVAHGLRLYRVRPEPLP